MADNVQAVLSTTSDLQVREAMLLGSYLEGGWYPPFSVGDQGTSFGPYQMHIGGALTSSGLSPLQASNPTLATEAMLPAYQAAVRSVNPTLWKTNPEQAAEQAAFRAERPAQDYYATQGSNVSAGWAAVQKALHGQTSTSGGSSSSAAPAGSTFLSDIGGLFGLPNFSGFTSAAIKSSFERVGLVIFGGLLVLAGIVIFAIPAAKTGAKYAVQGAATGRALGMGGAARAADIERRQDIANRSLALGERKIAIQQQRENRLARSR